MRNLIIALVLCLSLQTAFPAHAASNADVTQNKVLLKFPETATFQITVNNGVEIKSIVLEYGNQQQTCGEVIAKAFPQFTPSKNVHAEWTWDMRQSGSLPPGAQLWWRWRITDANGQETLTEKETTTWLDQTHKWQTMNKGDYLRLHWYKGSQDFAAELAQAAADGLQFNETQSGLKAD